jgi:RNA polymerase sigma factor (sigma-70 family)
MKFPNPLAEGPPADAEDLDLIRLVQSGSTGALEALISRHQRWIYNIAVRMVFYPQDAEDATQEILLKLVTKLSTFRGESQFRTWLYRLAVNHLLNLKRGRAEAAVMNFEAYGHELDRTPEADVAAPESQQPDALLLIEEAKIGCTSAMLLCLDREQRLVYVLGEIFGATDRVGADLLDISRDNFRQKLARARRDLCNFMQGKCGLVNASNPCRCARKTQGFIQLGYLDPQNLLFARHRVLHVHDVVERRSEELDDLHAAYAELHRHHPFHESPDFAASLRALLERSSIRTGFDT